MKEERTQVVIVGAGPAGLVLSHALARVGIECVMLEARSRDYVERRVRAGVLEERSVRLLDDLHLTERLRRERLVHHGLLLQVEGSRFRIDLARLAGASISVYAQQELVKDLIAIRVKDGGDIRFDAEVVSVADDGSAASVEYRSGRSVSRLRCDLVAGCDGSEGVCRSAVVAAGARLYTKDHRLAWLGILAAAAPSSDELVYARHSRGFALHSMRSPSVSRLYLQVDPKHDVSAWTEEQIWRELDLRLGTVDGWRPNPGPILDMSKTPVRSTVVEPIRRGRIALLGDAGHVVPPTGAKGMNLAIADAVALAGSVAEWMDTRDDRLLDRYSADRLSVVWRAQDFSLSLTAMLHTHNDPFEDQRQAAALSDLARSPAVARLFALRYVGLDDDVNVP